MIHSEDSIPSEQEQVTYEGDILNGRKDISQELNIPAQNQLHSGIQSGTQAPFDSVTASHLHWGTRPPQAPEPSPNEG